ncbi:hypothetical protein LguiA_017643 [Lonicera macranthoides]
MQEFEDAQKICVGVIDCFEKAVLLGLTEEERKANLHFVLVGGGPTGVEFAAELHDFFQEDLFKLYPGVKDLKFRSDGIEVLTGRRVVSVTDKVINMKLKYTGEHSSISHGMVVWSTGVGTRPVIMDFMEQIGQEDIYTIFDAADTDKSGTLSVDEFKEVIDDIIIRYPQVDLYVKSKHLLEVTDLLKDAMGNYKNEVGIEGFMLALSQVAAQQGAYLSRCFNLKQHMKENPEGPLRFQGSGRHKFNPFRCKHFGQFAPLGGDQAAAELPED